MKTIFDKATRDELTARINMLTENRGPAWGKMNVYQMLKHCTLWEEMALGKKHFKRMFLGRLFGKLAKKDLMKDVPMRRNAPTIPELRVRGTGDMAWEKKKWIGLIEEYERYSNPDFIHPFAGKMTEEQVGRLAYKHADHHLRQFNC
jgi:Protein of unknown function (DUF1569)